MIKDPRDIVDRASTFLINAAIVFSMIAIMIFLLLILLETCAVADAVAGEGIYFEIGAGYDRHIDSGRNPQSVVRLRYEMDNRSWWTPDVLEIDHHSSFQDGAPFNNKAEDTVGQASVIWRFKLK